MPLKSSRLRRILLVAAVTTVIAFSFSAAFTEDSDSVLIDAAASEPDANSVTIAEFTATNEWQELLPGQGVPPGLHVRMNLETGKREAKLLDPEEEDNGESMGSVVIDSNTKDKTVTVSTSVSGDIVLDGNDHDDLLMAIDADDVVGTPSQLKEAEEERDDKFEPDWNHEKIFDVLKALPEPPKVEGMDIHEAHEKLSPAAFRRQIVALWKKRQAELKEAFESLQDDAKYLGNLLEQFTEAEHNNDTTSQLNVLEVLEWEVQDLDKTRVFNYIGGFGIISDYLGSTNLPVRAYAEWVIGSATKNYNDGQEWAIDAGVLPKLMSSLSLNVPDDERAANDVLEVKKKAIYALSSIVRSNERGQRLFLLNNGPELLAGMINDAHPDRLQLKVLYFVYDLLVETADSKLHIDDNQSAPPTLLELEAIFQSTEWCERVCTTFVRTAPLLADREVIELVDAMSHQLPACQDVQRASGVMSVVKKLAQGFAEDQGRDDEEKKELAHFFHQFLSHVSYDRSPEQVPLRS